MRMEKPDLIQNLQAIARQIRIDVITMIHKSSSGHPGGALSATDILTALYFHEMAIDPQNPNWEERDRFILSKGHCCPVLYAALARKGFFQVAHLDTLRQFESILQGHPCMNTTPGLDMTSGSLGNGLGIGLGMALGARLLGKKFRVFVMVGDGELQEGSNWEAMMAASHFKADNLCMIIDYNHLQVDGTIEQIMNPAPIKEKVQDFGWSVLEIDGHSIKEILQALDSFTDNQLKGDGKPFAILAHTVKGKGVSFMENKVEWHGLAPTREQTEQAVKELEAVK
jgi:transketolase